MNSKYILYIFKLNIIFSRAKMLGRIIWISWWIRHTRQNPIIFFYIFWKFCALLLKRRFGVIGARSWNIGFLNIGTNLSIRWWYFNWRFWSMIKFTLKFSALHLKTIFTFRGLDYWFTLFRVGDMVEPTDIFDSWLMKDDFSYFVAF